MLALIGNASSRLFVAVATIAFFVLACDQATDDADVQGSGTAPVQTVHPANTPDKDLPLTYLRKDKYTPLQLGEWRYQAESALPWLEVSSVRRTESRVFLGVDCEKNVERSLQILQELQIPLDAVRVEATGYVKPDVHPPAADLFDCYPPEVVDPVTGISRPGFGGLYLESDIAYIYLLEPSQELGEELVREELGGKGAFESIREVRVLEGQFTWDQLWAWYELISRGDGWGEGTNIRFAEPAPKENRIKLVSYPDKPLVIERIEERLSSLGVPREAVIFVDERE